MPSTKTTTRTIRIKNETAEYFKGKPLNRYVDELCEKMQSGESDGINVHTEIRKVSTQKENSATDSVHTQDDNLEEIEKMLPFFNISKEEFYEKLRKSMEKGDVMYEDGRFVAVNEIDLSRFKEACDEKGIEYQKAVDKMTQEIMRG